MQNNNLQPKEKELLIRSYYHRFLFVTSAGMTAFCLCGVFMGSVTPPTKYGMLPLGLFFICAFALIAFAQSFRSRVRRDGLEVEFRSYLWSRPFPFVCLLLAAGNLLLIFIIFKLAQQLFIKL